MARLALKTHVEFFNAGNGENATKWATLSHWESHFTNTCIEELNSVFSATKRKARGHHTTKEANHHAPLRRR